MSADFAKKLDIKVKICIIVVCATVAHTTLFLEKSMPKIMKILNNISRCQAVYRRRMIPDEGLCAHQYAFALAICYKPGRSQEELARELCLDKSTVARTIASLEKNGYITRIENEDDKRQYLVHPTEKMLGIYPSICQANEMWNEQIEKGITKEELDVFYSVLSRMEMSARLAIETEADE